MPSRPLWPWSLSGTLAAAVALLLAYRYIIHPQYDYLGYHWGTPDFGLLGLSLLALLGLSVLLPPRIIRPSDFMLWVIFITVVLPVVIVCNVTGQLNSWQIAGVVFFVGGSFALATLIAKWGKDLPLPRPSGMRSATYWWTLGVFCVGALVVLVGVNGLRLTITDIFSVYEVRDEYKAGLDAFPLLAYLVPTLGYVVIPLILVRGLHRRSWVLVVLGICAQVFLYAQTGFKTYLFGIPVILVLAAMIAKRLSGAMIAGGIALGVLGAALVDAVTGGVVASSLFTRRFLATPGQIAAYYFDFFSEHRYVLLAEGPLSGLVSYPFDLPVAFMLGREIHGVDTNSSNVNFFADGFAQGGWPGVLLAGLLFGVILVLVDWASDGLPVSVGAMLMFLPCIVLGNASILTSLLSHGMVAAIVILALAPRDGWRPDPPPLRRRNLLSVRA